MTSDITELVAENGTDVDTPFLDTDLTDTDPKGNVRERPDETLYLELSPPVLESVSGNNPAPVPSLVETCGLCEISAEEPNEYRYIVLDLLDTLSMS